MDDNLTEHQKKIKTKLKQHKKYYDYIPDKYIDVIIVYHSNQVKILEHFDLTNTTTEQRFEIYEKVLNMIELFVIPNIEKMNRIMYINERNAKITRLVEELLNLVNNPFQEFTRYPIES